MMAQEVELEKSFTCPNPRCRKPFPNTVCIHNHNSGQPLQYYGCPYCLTAIEEGFRNSSEMGQPPTQPEVRCEHNYGYLSHRSKETDIPEECFLCQQLTGCMLFKVK
jgi:hypothetical protein